MIALPTGVRVWIAAGHTDMRRGMQSLALQVSRDNLDENGATIWMRRGGRAGLIIDAGRRLGKA